MKRQRRIEDIYIYIESSKICNEQRAHGVLDGIDHRGGALLDCKDQYIDNSFDCKFFLQKKYRLLCTREKIGRKKFIVRCKFQDLAQQFWIYCTSFVYAVLNLLFDFWKCIQYVRACVHIYWFQFLESMNLLFYFDSVFVYNGYGARIKV